MKNYILIIYIIFLYQSKKSRKISITDKDENADFNVDTVKTPINVSSIKVLLN